MERIFLAVQGSAAMQEVEAAEAVPGCGLKGDRYCLRTGYWTGVDECQVTLIAAEGLAEVSASGIAVDAGQHRRNIVTAGVPLASLRGHAFRVGEAVLSYDRPRPPCRHVEMLTQPGMTRALGGGRGGICARVEVGGLIRPGDPITLLRG